MPSEATSADAPMNVLITLSPMSIVQAAADLVWSPVVQRFPRLNFALSEDGIGWVPYSRERIDYTYGRHRVWTEPELGGRTPSHIFDEQIAVCFIADPIGVQLRNSPSA